MFLNTKNFQQQCSDCGYKETIQYLNGEFSKEDLIEKIKMESRRYAKRQLTWFRRNQEIVWLDGEKNMDYNLDVILSKI